MSTSTKNNFNQALRDLKEINEQLFYKELKEKLSDHESQLELEYEKVARKAQEMHEQMERFEHNFNTLANTISAQFRAALQNIEEGVPAIFDGQTAILQGAYDAFSNIAEDQRVLLERKDTEWRELAVHVKEKQQETLQNLADQLNGEVAGRLEQMENGAIRHRQEIADEARGRLAEFGIQVQRQREQFESLMETLAGGQQQFQGRVEALLQGFMAETNEQLRKSETQMKQVEKAVEEVSKAQGVHLAEIQQLMKLYSEEQTAGLTAMQQWQHEKWEDQDSKLTNLDHMQQNQAQTMKKWFIGLIASQVVVVGAVVGLYIWPF